MSFLKQLSEKLESQVIYDGQKGKYESRFRVDGNDYTFLATSLAGDSDDNFQWMLEFENAISHRIGMGDDNPKIAKAFGEAVGQWVKERNPNLFYTYGSHIDSIKNIISSIKKKVKGYNLIDDSADKKNEENGEVIEGNPVGKITWTKMLEQEVTTSEKKADTKTEKLEPGYELPKDIKPFKAFMSGTSKKDKLDKGDKSYDLKKESVLFPQKLKPNQFNVGDKVSFADEAYMLDPNPIPPKYLNSVGIVKQVIPNSDKISIQFKDGKVLDFESKLFKKSGLMDKLTRHAVANHHPEYDEDKYSESFAEFKARKFEEIDEGKRLDALKGLARAALKRFQEKFKDMLKSIVTVAGSSDDLLKWLEANQTDFIHAMDIVKHMTDKKQLTFEDAVLSGELIQENLLDLIAKKSPKALMGAALILVILGSGQSIFGANDTGEEAFKKAKSNVEKIVEIIKDEGGKMLKDIVKATDKPAEKGAEEIGHEAKKAGENVAQVIKKGAEVAGQKIGAGVEKAKAGVQAQFQKKPERQSPPPPKRIPLRADEV